MIRLPKNTVDLPSSPSRDILAAMHKTIQPFGLALALSILILIHPAPHVQAAGTPTSAETLPTSTTESPSTDAVTGYYYTVQPTDTLWDIAVAHRIAVETLIAANELPDPRQLMAGTKIFVPAHPAAVPRKPAPTVPVAPSTPVPEATVAPAQEAAQTTTPADAPADPPSTEPAAADTPTAAPMPEPSPTPAPESAAAAEPDGWPAEILELVNAKRAAQGLPALTWSPELARAAQAHAEDCAQRNRGSHIGSDGATLPARLERVDYAARSASENWANAQSVQHAFGMWWNEPRGRDPHRRNILDPKYCEIGIGVAKGPWGYYFIADFISQ